jgi:GT2 family glycosyltransferase
VYQASVEPALAASVRVHRFAAVPQIADASVASAPLAVWIDVEGGSPTQEAMDASLRSLAASTVGAIDVLHGPLPFALGDSRAERLVLLRAGDQLAPLALERLGQAGLLAPDAAVLTCDDDRLARDGSRSEPTFRPGPSPDHWLAAEDSGPLLVVAREPAAAAAGSIAGGEGWRHQLACALAGPGGERHAHVPLLLCHQGLGAPSPGAEVRRSRWPIAGEPLVEVVICFRDRPELLARCVDSLLAVTAYERVSVALVDNGSVEGTTAELLARLTADRRVRLLRDPRPFNYAALNNAAAVGTQADVLVFLNNDIEVTDPAWVECLLEEALRPEVGAVAPLLLYPEGTVQHAGAALGLHGYAGHPFAGLAPGAPTPFGRADGGTRNWLGVTAACMMVERRKFAAVGGFDETFVVAGNDIDLCLRLTAAGYRSLCLPHTSLIHAESKSRGTHIDPQDFVTSERSYGAFRTVGDPFYNPNLTLSGTDCAVRIPGEG